MPSEGEAKRGLCSVKERLKEGDCEGGGSKRAMLIEGEAKRGQCSVKYRHKKGDAY